jgi:hypothetical protein
MVISGKELRRAANGNLENSLPTMFVIAGCGVEGEWRHI